MSEAQGQEVSCPVEKPWLEQNVQACLLSLLVGLLSLTFDSITPLGVAAGVAYILFVLTAFGYPDKHTPFLFAALSTLFIAIGFFLVENSHTSSQWSILLNRALSVLAVWVVAWIVYSQKQSQERIVQNAKNNKQEEEMVNQLYDLTIDDTLSSDQKIERVLQLGLSFLESKLGLVSEISGERYMVLHSAAAGAMPTKKPLHYADTYCAHVFGSPEVKVGADAEASGISMANAYQSKGVNTYIGTTLFVDGKAYGTLAFLKLGTSEKPYSDSEKNLVRLMAQWVSSELTQMFNLRKIEESEKFSNLVQDSIPDLIFVKDDQFRIVHGNPAFMNVYPESIRDSIIGTTTVESYSKEDAELFLEQDRIALDTGYSEVEETVQFPDGRERTLLTRKIRFQDGNGQYFILGVGRDITNRKKVEQSLEQLVINLEDSNKLNQAIMNSAQHLIISTDPEGVVTSFNKASEKSLGYRADDLIGKETPALWHDLDEVVARAEELSTELGKAIAPSFDVFVEKARSGTPETREWTFVRRNASRFPAQLTVTCLRGANKKITGYLGIIEDISARKQAEEELLRSNQELERFAYVASHDLQEPLRMVMSFTGLLEKNYGDKLDERALKYIEFASSGAVRMQHLVKDLLEYARIGSESESLETVDLNDVVISVKENLAENIQQTGAEIHCQALPTIRATPVRIFSLFQNVIGNALKYRQADCSPRIDISVRSFSDQWQISIADNGIGMKQEYCVKIFEPFQRLHRKDEYAGTGMGLSICRKSIEELGGKIWVQSQLGKGSTFYFTLPKNKSD